jgi:hypothetical protein
VTARRSGERGQVAGIEALPFGLLIFVAGVLLLVNVWGVVDTKFAAESAAREATRHLVEVARLDADHRTLVAETEAAAGRTFADHGKRAALQVDVSAEHDGFQRCSRVRVRVTTSVPAIRLPFFGGFGDAFDIVATHSELVDPTRSGVAGRADCVT